MSASHDSGAKERLRTLVVPHLERIADHAVNIAERVVYMVTGERVTRVRAADRAKG